MTTPMLRALELARWAPSGDNEQPWRFTLLSPTEVRIRATHHPENPYEYGDGLPILIALGTLLECLRLAATREGYQLEWSYEGRTGNDFFVLARLQPAGLAAAALVAWIESRSVNRKPMHTTPLTETQKTALLAALDGAHHLQLLETRSERWAATRLNLAAADIRYRLPEAFPVHQRMMEWEQPTSATKLPVGTLPASPLTRHMMRWALGSWKRVDFMNRYLGGTLAPRFEFELIPGMASAAHLLLARTAPAADPATATLADGMQIQRLWLTLESVGLTLQPSYSPIIFSYHARQGAAFTRNAAAAAKAVRLAAGFEQFCAARGVVAEQVVFLARIGAAKGDRSSRSLRLPLAALIEG